MRSEQASIGVSDISDERTLRSTDQAVDNAAQLAKLLTGQPGVLYRVHRYHGSLLAMLPSSDTVPGPKIEELGPVVMRGLPEPIRLFLVARRADARFAV